uniref:Uncharacterized protein n=1 Tax=Kalanchoe fedtschenkoi TaxID=63787 RepID=A0A7N0TXB0_KALFE
MREPTRIRSRSGWSYKSGCGSTSPNHCLCFSWFSLKNIQMRSRLALEKQMRIYEIQITYVITSVVSISDDLIS